MTSRRKKLIEVALPLAVINEESAREKSIRHGHPSTLHLWWARRPLAACRAVLFAQFVDDPESDPQFRRADGSVDIEAARRKRKQLFDLIEELVKWENSNNPRIINSARSEIARCVASLMIEKGELQPQSIVFGPEEGKIAESESDYTAAAVSQTRSEPKVVNHFLATYAPPVLDPFAGGGSIPLEAQRLGLRAHASDLNPVAVLINKALIEIPPRFAEKPPFNPDWHQQAGAHKKLRQFSGAQGLAEDVKYYGHWMRNEAEKRIGHLYPKVKITQEMADDGRPDLKPYVGQELTVIAWLWARTVASPNPAYSDVDIPLMSSFWLSKKKDKKVWLEPIINQEKKIYSFQIRLGDPNRDQQDQVDSGTKIGKGGKFKCIMSDIPIEKSHIKSESKSNRLGNKLFAIVLEGNRERIYLTPSELVDNGIQVDKPENIDDIAVSIGNDPRAIWCVGYGLDTFEKLFTPRQLTALVTFSDLVQEARREVLQHAQAAGTLPDDPRPLSEGGHGPTAYADAVSVYLSFGVDKSVDYWSAICSWHNSGEKMRNTFSRQAIPMVWDLAEANPFSNSTGNWNANIDWVVKAIYALPANGREIVIQRDATDRVGLSTFVVSSDPPYYDNIGYSDLSDFFYIWLRKTIHNVYPDLFSTLLTPKASELIASPYRHEGSRQKAGNFFEENLSKVIKEWRRNTNNDIPITIYYAFKQSETDDHGTISTGWATFIDSLLTNNFSITATWPMRTEMSSRTIASGTNALASSVVLACVPRSEEAVMATRREFLTDLKNELPGAIRKMQSGNVLPVDMAQASIGPGMAVFSRYSKVVEADGSAMSVRTALALINQVLDEVLAEQEGEYDADTRWAVTWFENNGVSEGLFGDADNLSRARNTSVEGLVDAGVVISRGGKVRLVTRDELPTDWDPANDNRLTAWEVVQHVIHRLDKKGEQAAADLLRRLGSDQAERAHDLAYRLYSIAERKQWANEARAYNSLVLAWPEIQRLAQQEESAEPANRDLF